MAAAVAPALLSHDLHLNDASAVARKRRREILATQRLVSLPDVVSADVEIRADDHDVAHKIRRLSDDGIPDSESLSSKSDEASKRTQMKYDPPPNMQMSKEETAAWRREQRRKRNRESAAASRQRQRDRIVELEEELEQWKAKFNSLSEKLKQAGGATTTPPTEVISSDVKEAAMCLVSPSNSPRLTPCVSPVPTQSLSFIESGMVSPDGASVNKEAEEEHSKMFPRQA